MHILNIEHSKNQKQKLEFSNYWLNTYRIKKTRFLEYSFFI